MAKSTGTVKWFNSTKGFGFIQDDAGGEDHFVHQSDILADGFRSLADGETVEFVVQTGPDGRTKAVSVTGPNGAPVQGAPRRQFNERDSFGGGGGSYGGGRGNYGTYAVRPQVSRPLQIQLPARQFTRPSIARVAAMPLRALQASTPMGRVRMF